MANEHGEPFVLDFPNGQRVEDILKKAQSDYSKAEIDAKMSSKANAEDVYSKSDVDTALSGKVDKETGKGLSTNDYTTAEKNKLAGIEAQANKTTVDDALDDSSTNPVQNKVVKAALDNKADTADIPTVPITAIQKNGTGITPVSGTVNITVPTTAADVSALPDTTKYAVALSLTINSSTFVITGQLKDQNGDNLGIAQTIDLPLESVVVGGSYNSQTQKVVLTLQNGNTIEFSVADLVSGLQTELSVSNKLNPAYINYDSTHRAVSDTEKSTWNGKQDALSAAQLAAANSGIDSAKVAQIETNKNNISFAVEKIGNNLVNVPSGSGVRWVDVTVNIPPGVYTFGFSNLSGDDIRQSQVSFYSADSNFYTHIDKGNDVYINNVTFTNTVTNIRIYASINSTTSTNQGVNFTTLFLCKQETWNSSVGIQPYALSNAELTEKLYPTDYTVLTPSNADISAISGGYFKVGKIVYINARITISSEQGGIIFYGLPLVKNSTAITTGQATSSVTALSLTTGISDTNLIIANDTSHAIIAVAGSHSVISAGTYIISGFYLST